MKLRSPASSGKGDGSADALADTGLVRAARYLQRGEPSPDGRERSPAGRATGRGVLPGALAPRQGGALHPRGELHRVVLVAGVRQGRDHHLGDPGRRLPLGRPGLPRVRAAGLPEGRVVLVVHVLAGPGPLPLRARRAARAVPRGPGAPRRPGGCLGGDHRATPERAGRYKSARGQGGFVRASWPEVLELIAAAHVHTVAAYGPDRTAGFTRHPGHVDGLLRGRYPLLLAARRHHPVVLRLVRRPAHRLAPGLRRPDRRARVGRLVERLLPHPLGHQPARSPAPPTPTS